MLVSSTAGQRGESFHCDYAATKGALISMVKGLSTELARDGIYVNSVAPGWVDTDMSKSALNDPETRNHIFAAIPLGRVATAEEIAGPILFFVLAIFRIYHWRGVQRKRRGCVGGLSGLQERGSSLTSTEPARAGRSRPHC